MKKPARDEIKKRIKENEKLFMYKEEEKRRIQDEEEEEPWTNFNSMAPPPRHSRSSCARRRFQENQPEDAQPSPVLQGMVNCLTSISCLMLRISGVLARMEAGPGSTEHTRIILYFGESRIATRSIITS
jgi:hypothetical protein